MPRIAAWGVCTCLILVTGFAAEPAIIQAARAGDLEELRRLVATGGAMHAQGAHRQTALHEAAATCNVEAARLLSQAGVDRMVRDDSGRTAAMIAVRCSDREIKNQMLRLLWVPPPLLQGAPIETPRWTLQDAAARGDGNIVEMLLKLGSDVNALNPKGDRALEVACRRGDPAMVRRLLEAGADVKLPTSSGTTALHEAALGGDPRVIELLIAKGALVDAPDKENAATPLHYAASFGRLEAVRVLLSGGADPHRKDRRGTDPLRTAETNNQTDVVQLLRTIVAK